MIASEAQESSLGKSADDFLRGWEGDSCAEGSWAEEERKGNMGWVDWDWRVESHAETDSFGQRSAQ